MAQLQRNAVKDILHSAVMILSWISYGHDNITRGSRGSKYVVRRASCEGPLRRISSRVVRRARHHAGFDLGRSTAKASRPASSPSPSFSRACSSCVMRRVVPSGRVRRVVDPLVYVLGQCIAAPVFTQQLRVFRLMRHWSF